MATAPQAAMEMPQQGANPYEDPNTMAIYDQMRQSVSPKQFGDEVLAGASQVDPQAVAAFKAELEQIQMPPEALDLLNNMVDEILANPEKYAEIRAKYKEMDAPDEILPEQFDAQFFTALNMAVDQMIGAPAGPEAFAKGGIAELKPVSKAIANYGRNGDTMLAHITPAEARMLRRKGGSGTINPKTGLPEFFNLFKSIGKAFKSVGNAVKSFVNSTVGKIVTTVALGFFLGPAAASFLGVSSAAGVAAVSGFVGSAGSTILGGGNLGDALKAGAIGGLTAGAGAGIMGGSEAFASGSYTGPTTVSGQYNKLIGAPTADVTTTTAREAAARQAAISPTGEVANMAPNPMDATQFEGSLAKNIAPTDTSYLDQAKDFYNKNISPSGIQQQGLPAAQEAGAKAVTDLVARMPDATPAMKEAAYQKALSAASPGIFSTYAPITAAGLGVMGLAGGFSPSKPDESKIKPELLKSATQRIAEQNKQKEYYVQNLPGVKYDEFGAPIYGAYNPLPTTPAAKTPTSNFNLPATIGGIGSLYTPPPGTIGTQKPISQPYNTASMYTNLMPPQRFADGGDVTSDAALVDAQRAALIAQAQALGQSGYNPSSAGSAQMQRAAYTPSTGFAQFTQQYRQNNPAPVFTRPTPTPTSGTSLPTTTTTIAPPIDLTQLPVNNYQPPVDTYQPPVDTYEDPYQPPVDTYQPPVDTYEDPYQPPNDTYIPPVDTYEDPYQPPVDTYQPPVDTYEDPFQPPVDTYQPPVDTYEDPYQPPVDTYQPPVDTYEDPYQAPMNVYQPPVDTYEDPYQAPMNTYQPPVDTYEDPYQAPMNTYQPPVDTYEDPYQTPVAPPVDVYQPPMDAYTPPADAYQPPTDAYTPPMDAYMPTVAPPADIYQPPADAYTPPADVYQPPMDAYQPPADIYQPPMETYTPPMDVYTPPADVYQPPMDAYQPPMDAYQPPMDVYTPPADVYQPPMETYTPPMETYTPPMETYQPPMESYQPTVYEAPSYTSPVSDYNTFGFNGGEDGGKFGDFGASFGGVGGGGGSFDDYSFMSGFNTGGIASLRSGGYPRRTGQISGPGTATSDSIPAMLSDGEFVMTAKAVRGAGKGDRRAGAKRMYALMHQLEKNASRG